ncbi:hypothetical protein LTS18_002469 [Coniosporium uncinatum]|uniref:Uncharacterized protein n=1 Tax=Coniosporium uncinatum TaxID=93489 RepID=A0ACC3DBM7_9PEZI|nr:hypothetical protein LTS18_002469 [Coniosporium uncinatum]
MASFTDAIMTSNVTDEEVRNPYYFGVAAITNGQGGGADTLNEPQEIVTPVHGATAFVLGCSTAVYDVEYGSVNATVTGYVTTLTNLSVVIM